VSDALANAVERLYAALVRRARREVPEPSTLTPTQRLALSVAVDAGPLRLGALAQRLGTSDSAATRAVDALAAAGLAERVADPVDGRAVQVAATKTGRARVAETRDRLRRVLGAGAIGLDESERANLVELLEQLIAALEDEPKT
jgi:DNA-binding MarR family transcriptional regulator